MVKRRSEGVASVPPAPVARTRKACGTPSASYAAGDVHGANAAPSSEHANVAAGSSEAKLNVAVRRPPLCASSLASEHGR